MGIKVAVWGKFDRLHKGHLEFLKNARALGDELYVIIIPDKKLRENPKELPTKTAEERRIELARLKMVTGTYVDCLDDGLHSILRLKPDIFAFGHDQKTEWEEKLKQYLSSQGLQPKYIYLGLYNQGLHATDLNRLGV